MGNNVYGDSGADMGGLSYTFDTDEQGDFIRFFDGRDPIRDDGNNNMASFFFRELVATAHNNNLPKQEIK